MIPTPEGPCTVEDLDGVLRCFDASAGAVYSWICRLLGDDTDAVALLAAVFGQLEERRSAAGSLVVDGPRLEATTFAILSASAGPNILHRALADLAIEQRRDPEDIAAILGIPLIDVDRRTAEMKSLPTLDDVVTIAHGGGWLDDVSRRAARDAIASGAAPTRPTLIHPAPPAHRWVDDRVWTSMPTADPATRERTQRPRPARRRAAVAGGVIATFLLGAFWWSGSSDADRSSSPDGTPLDLGSPPSSSPDSAMTGVPTIISTGATTATAAATADSSPYAGPGLRLKPGFLIDNVPEGFTPSGLYESTASENMAAPGMFDTWFQAWAEPGAGRATGRWLAMNTRRSVLDIGYIRTGWTRVAGDGFTGLRHVGADGVVELELRVIRRTTADIGVDILSFGMTEPDLERVAVSLVHAEPASTIDRSAVAAAMFEPSSAVADVMRGMELVGVGPVGCCGIQDPVRTPLDTRVVSYSRDTESPSDQWFSIETRDGLAAAPLSRFLVEHSTDPLAPTNPSATMLVGDRVVHVSATSWDDGVNTVVNTTGWWVEGGRTVSVSGTVGLRELTAMIASARRATDDEWLQLNEQIFLTPQPEYVDPGAGPTVTIGSVMLDDDSTWSFQVGTDAGSGQLVVIGGLRDGQGPGGTILPSDGAEHVIEYDSIDATGVVVLLRNVDSPGARIRVTVAGRAPSTVPLVHVGATDVWMAFDAFWQLPPYTIELVDAAGATLRAVLPRN